MISGGQTAQLVKALDLYDLGWGDSGDSSIG